LKRIRRKLEISGWLVDKMGDYGENKADDLFLFVDKFVGFRVDYKLTS